MMELKDADLRRIYPDPLGGNHDMPMDVYMRRAGFDRNLHRAIENLRKAAADLGGYVGHRALQDPQTHQWASLLRDARVQALHAIDGILSDMEADR